MKGRIVNEIFNDRNITIYLPPNYKEAKEGLPVVYVNDGETLFNPEKTNSIEKLELMFQDNGLREFIIVGIESKNRINDYTPWSAKALSERFSDFGGEGDKYLSFIVDKLKPHIDSSYFTDKSFENTGIIGASLGGLISLYALYLYPKVFGKIGAISPSLWYEGFNDYIKDKTSSPSGSKIYMDVGSNEGMGKESVQKFMVRNVKEAQGIFLAKGYSNSDFKFVFEEGTVHCAEAFIRRFPYALQWLFS